MWEVPLDPTNTSLISWQVHCVTLVVTQELFSWIFTCALVRILNNNEAGVVCNSASIDIFTHLTRKKKGAKKSLSFPAHFGIKLFFFGTTFVPGFPQSNNRNSKIFIKFLFRMSSSAFYWIVELGRVGALTVFFEIESSNSSTRSWWFSYLYVVIFAATHFFRPPHWPVCFSNILWKVDVFFGFRPTPEKIGRRIWVAEVFLL